MFASVFDLKQGNVSKLGTVEMRCWRGSSNLTLNCVAGILEQLERSERILICLLINCSPQSSVIIYMLHPFLLKFDVLVVSLTKLCAI